MSTTDLRKTTAHGFRKTWAEDRRSGRRRTLVEYLKLFPGDEITVAEEFLALERELGSEPAGGEPAAEAPAVVGRFKLLRELGRGSQARVYLAEDARFGRRVALKVLALHADDVEDHLLRFLREAEVASRIDHPGICPVLDAGCSDGHAWIAMRHVEGVSLAHAIRNARVAGLAADTFFEIEELAERPEHDDPFAHTSGPGTRAEVRSVLRLVEKAARALHAAHEAGVVHRDVKPGNILVTPEGEPVLLDFGLARRLEDARHGLTEVGQLCGSPAYAAPEALRGEGGGPRGDVWALGVTLFEALTHTRPFRGANREALVRAVLEDATPSARALNPNVPADVDAVLGRALEKNRERRYSSALDLAEDLRRVLDYEPIRAVPVGPFTRFRRWCRRRPGTATAVAAVFALLVAGLGVTGWFLDREADQRLRLERTLEALKEENSLRESLVNRLEQERRVKEAFFDMAFEALVESPGAPEEDVGAASPPRFRDP